MLHLKEMAQSGVKQNKALWEDICYQTEQTVANSVGALHQGTQVPLRNSWDQSVSGIDGDLEQVHFDKISKYINM